MYNNWMLITGVWETASNMAPLILTSWYSGSCGVSFHSGQGLPCNQENSAEMTACLPRPRHKRHSTFLCLLFLRDLALWGKPATVAINTGHAQWRRPCSEGLRTPDHSQHAYDSWKRLLAPVPPAWVSSLVTVTSATILTARSWQTLSQNHPS